MGFGNRYDFSYDIAVDPVDSTTVYIADNAGIFQRSFEALRRSADFDGDGTVALEDFLLFVRAFGRQGGDPEFEGRFDLNADGSVNFQDFLIFARRYGTGG